MTSKKIVHKEQTKKSSRNGKKKQDHKLDERLEETFPASDATAKYK